MKICYLDAFSGISGDMTVGALLDAGAPYEPLLDALRSLDTGATFACDKTIRGGVAATKFRVTINGTQPHRHLSHILRLIDGASLPDRVKQNASAVFTRLGEAEAQVHGMPIEKVHFHEVGAADSIADIVGACLALDLLGIERIHSSAINVGSGTVKTEHGFLPVPDPCRRCGSAASATARAIAISRSSPTSFAYSSENAPKRPNRPWSASLKPISTIPVRKSWAMRWNA
jgi:uncharacterized protein (DUF111 family)